MKNSPLADPMVRQLIESKVREMKRKNSLAREMESKYPNGIRALDAVEFGRRKNSEAARLDYGALLDAHLNAMTVIGTILLSKDGVSGKTNASISRRLSLTASFVQGIGLCETSISEGLYAQAAALIKQEMETIAGIEEYVDGTRHNKKTPNVGRVRWDLAKKYGDLNRVAHLADHEAVHPLYQVLLNAESTHVSIVPKYHPTTSRSLYALHVALMVQLAVLMADLHEEMYGEVLTEADQLLLAGAIEMLKREGFLS